MDDEIVPSEISKALDQIDRLRALIVDRYTGDNIQSNEPLGKDIADLRAAVDALDQAFQNEGKGPNGTEATGKKTSRAKIRIRLFLLAASMIGLAYFFSNPHPWTYFDYTYRSARALVSGSLSLDEPPTSWMNEMIPFESHYYSAFPFGSVLTLVPVAVLQKLHLIDEFPTMAVVGITAGCIALLLLLYSLQYEVSNFKRGVLTAAILFGTCMWCNLAFGGTWQLNLGFAVLGEIGALYFTRRGAPFLAGAFFALAFGNRTEIILLVPVFFYLLGGEIKKCFKFSIVPILLGLATLLYNDLRFHSPFDFGYARIPGVLKELRHGIFSIYAVPDNIKAMLLDFSWKVFSQYPYLVPHTFGGSIFLSSPFLVLIFRRGARDRKLKIAAWVAITLLIVPLWLHGNPGGWQFSYRYMMILLPWIFVLLLESARPRVTLVESALFAVSILINAWASYLFLWTGYVQP
ncbi:MAG: hypothetical protein JO279_07175 [Verrucomicrobia bacterium]|nr:hypothetical protein [Verrucomicrobiota bacterium]